MDCAYEGRLVCGIQTFNCIEVFDSKACIFFYRLFTRRIVIKFWFGFKAGFAPKKKSYAKAKTTDLRM